jgi:hypothetical protein
MHDPATSALPQVADPLSPATRTTRANQRLNANGLAWFSANNLPLNHDLPSPKLLQLPSSPSP